MTTACPATHADVSNRWRPLDTQMQTVTSTLLGDAWRRLRRTVPDLATRLEAESTAGVTTDLQDETRAVLAAAVLRVVKNLDGSRRESIDDGTWEPDLAAASGLLYISGDELDRVRDTPVGQPAGAYVIPLGG